MVIFQALAENTTTSTFLGPPTSVPSRVVLDIDTGSDQFNQWTESVRKAAIKPTGRWITMRPRRRVAEFSYAMPR